MKPFKRLLSLFLCLVLVAVALPVSPAEASENDPLEHLSYTISDGAVTITDCDAFIKGCLIIPDTIEGFPVTTIGKQAFRYGNMSELIIPASVTTIQNAAFLDMEQLKTVVFLGAPPNFDSETFGIYSKLDWEEFGELWLISTFEGTICYPIHNPKWTSKVMQNKYGAISITWVGIHSWDSKALPTCTADGTVRYTCTVCNENVTETARTLNHTWGDGTLTPPTCTTRGNYLYTCTTCGETCTEVVWALGHSWEMTLNPAPTCTKNGSYQYTCMTCGKIETETIPRLGHSWDEGILAPAPTCTAEGLRLYTCTTCGDTITATVSALGHSWDEGTVITQPTCTQDGVRRYTCGTCSETREETISARHERGESIVTIPATCTQSGQCIHPCANCSYIFSIETLPATGHQFQKGVWLTQPGCETTGQKSYTCSTCGYIKYANFPATGHSEVTDPAIAATCTTSGLTEGKHCSTCNEVLAAQESIPATGHSYKTAVVTPTCTEIGSITNTCTTCGDTVTGIIPATGHQFEDGSCIHCGEPEAVSLPGDVNGDGKVNIMDVAKLYAHIKGTLLIEDETQLRQADLTGDGNVNILDIAKLYASVKGTE